MPIVEFFGLPGSGKTTIANSLALKIDTAVLKRSEILADGLRPVPRHFVRGKLIVHAFFKKPRFFFSAIRLVLSSRQDGVMSFLKSSWNLLSVLGLYVVYSERDEVLVVDQGVIQAAWSIKIRAASESLDWLGFLKKNKLLPDFLVLVDCGDDIASQRLAERKVGVSKLSGVSSSGSEWMLGRRKYESMVSEIEDNNMDCLKVWNDGVVKAEELAKDLFSKLMADSRS